MENSTTEKQIKTQSYLEKNSERDKESFSFFCLLSSLLLHSDVFLHMSISLNSRDVYDLSLSFYLLLHEQFISPCPASFYVSPAPAKLSSRNYGNFLWNVCKTVIHSATLMLILICALGNLGPNTAAAALMVLFRRPLIMENKNFVFK